MWHDMYPFFVVWIALKTGILFTSISVIFLTSLMLNIHRTLNLLKSVTDITHKEKRIDFMSNMKKCTIS